MSDILSVKDDLSVSRLQQPQHGTAQRTLSAAGFTHNTQRFSLLDGYADIVHRMEHTILFSEVLLQITHFQQRGIFRMAHVVSSFFPSHPSYR